jgi:hypothetical protein
MPIHLGRLVSGATVEVNSRVGPVRRHLARDIERCADMSARFLDGLWRHDCRAGPRLSGNNHVDARKGGRDSSIHSLFIRDIDNKVRRLSVTRGVVRHGCVDW